MSFRPIRKIRKSINRSGGRAVRTFGVALLIASVLAGLLPPPLVTSVATHIAPAPLEAELVEAATALADALPEAAVAEAAPVDAPSRAEPSAPTESVVAAPVLAPPAQRRPYNLWLKSFAVKFVFLRQENLKTPAVEGAVNIFSLRPPRPPWFIIGSGYAGLG